MDFEKDVFISYAHLDDMAMSEGLKGWITEFHKALEVRLSQVLGSEPKIWRDVKLQGNDFFAPEIASQFPKLKIMISIITPRYVQSEWCTKELELFYDAASKSGGIAIDNKARIFKVLKTPVEIEEQPDKIRPLLGYEFYRKDSESKRVREYGMKKDKEDAYWDTLSDVAYDIADLIEKLNDKGSNGNKPNITYTIIEAPETEKQKIYLAETSTDLKVLRNELKRELKDNGYVVLPDDYPAEFELAKYQTWVSENMEKCSLVVQLIGSKYGAIPETDEGVEEKSIVLIQNEIATELCDKKDLQRLIWIPEIQASEDHRVIALIEQLKKQNLKEGSEWLNGTIKEFTERIKITVQKLEAAEKEKKSKEEEKIKLAAIAAKQKEEALNNANSANIELPTAGSEVQMTTVFLIYDERDKANVSEIRKFLKSKDIYVDTITFDGTEQEKNSANEESMRNCDAVLIYYGQGSTSWLKGNINKVIQKPALKGKPLKAALIYKGLPKSDDKTDYDEPPRFLVADGQQGFNQDLFNEFLSKIK